MKNKIALILGARSDIAISVAHRFAKEGYDLQLAARNIKSLSDHKSEIQLNHGVMVTLFEFDALEVNSHEKFVDSLPQIPTIVICAVGSMGNQLNSELYVQAATKVMRSNFEGPASILGIFANHFEQRGFGILIGISSVAGERGRATNYIYGSSKAAMTAFLSGLRNRLAKKGVQVISVIPGFVKTKMTHEMNLPDFLSAQPDEVANAIFNAVRKKKNIVYVKSIWWLIMMIIRIIPEGIFKKINI
tara:strand:+ start:892 stop:1629 length:738 start_codon:yes stop_codon:yes gene_type:complete